MSQGTSDRSFDHFSHSAQRGVSYYVTFGQRLSDVSALKPSVRYMGGTGRFHA